MKPIAVRGRPLAGGVLPAVCIPLVATTEATLLAEAQSAAEKAPDLLEWRVDFFEGLADPARVAALAAQLKQATQLPVLFTRRSPGEGGQPVPIPDDTLLAVYRAVCEGGQVDLVDFEMALAPALIAQVRQAAQAAGVGLLLSFHDFQRTPAHEDLLARYRQAAQLGADVAKVSVMAKAPADVLRLLAATLQASGELAIPVAGISMGPLGVVARLGGGQFGSALTFAVGQAASAPGQVPIAELRAALKLLPSVG